MDQSLIAATWVQAIATVVLGAATLVLCFFTKSLYSATRDLARLTIDPQIEVYSPPLYVENEAKALLKIKNSGACELLAAQIQFEAVLKIANAGATIPESITEELGIHPMGVFKPREERKISYWSEAKEVLKAKNGFQPLENQTLISCNLHCCVVGQHPVSGVVYVHENIYEVTSSKTADIMLKDISPKTTEPTFKRISRSGV